MKIPGIPDFHGIFAKISDFIQNNRDFVGCNIPTEAASAYEQRFFIPFLTREASIQLVYQLCVVIQQFLYFPVKDLTAKPMIYARSNGASIQWILGLIFQLVSIFTSAFSAINLPLKVKYLKVFAKLLTLGRQLFAIPGAPVTG